MTGFSEGDRVKVIAKHAGEYLPPYRKMIAAGRTARIRWVRDYRETLAGRSPLDPPAACIRFEGKFKYPLSLTISTNCLEPAPEK